MQFVYRNCFPCNTFEVFVRKYVALFANIQFKVFYYLLLIFISICFFSTPVAATALSTWSAFFSPLCFSSMVHMNISLVYSCSVHELFSWLTLSCVSAFAFCTSPTEVIFLCDLLCLFGHRLDTF